MVQVLWKIVICVSTQMILHVWCTVVWFTCQCIITLHGQIPFDCAWLKCACANEPARHNHLEKNNVGIFLCGTPWWARDGQQGNGRKFSWTFRLVSVNHFPESLQFTTPVFDHLPKIESILFQQVIYVTKEYKDHSFTIPCSSNDVFRSRTKKRVILL